MARRSWIVGAAICLAALVAVGCGDDDGDGVQRFAPSWVPDGAVLHGQDFPNGTEVEPAPPRVVRLYGVRDEHGVVRRGVGVATIAAEESAGWEPFMRPEAIVPLEGCGAAFVRTKGMTEEESRAAIAAVRCDSPSGLAELEPDPELPLVGETDVANWYADALYFDSAPGSEPGFEWGAEGSFWMRATINAPDVNVLRWFGGGDLHAEEHDGTTYVVETGTTNGLAQVWFTHGTYLLNVGTDRADAQYRTDLATLLRIAASVEPISEARWDELSASLEARFGS